MYRDNSKQTLEILVFLSEVKTVYNRKHHLASLVALIHIVPSPSN
jgi:hypothetical protein